MEEIQENKPKWNFDFNMKNQKVNFKNSIFKVNPRYIQPKPGQKNSKYVRVF